MRAAQHTGGSHLHACWKLGVGQILVPKFTGTVVLKAFWGLMHFFGNLMGPISLFPTNISILLANSREFTGFPKRQGVLGTKIVQDRIDLGFCGGFFGF